MNPRIPHKRSQSWYSEQRGKPGWLQSISMDGWFAGPAGSSSLSQAQIPASQGSGDGSHGMFSVRGARGESQISDNESCSPPKILCLTPSFGQGRKKKALTSPLFHEFPGWLHPSPSIRQNPNGVWRVWMGHPQSGARPDPLNPWLPKSSKNGL